MARLVRPLRRTLSCSPKTRIPHLLQTQQQNPISLLSDNIDVGMGWNSFCLSRTQTSAITRSYVSEMRKAAFQDNILRLLRREIQYELDRPPTQPAVQFNSFTVDDRPGEQWIRLKRNYAGNEEIKVEATMFDGAIPISKSGGGGLKDDVKLHISFIVTISKADGDVLQIICSAWPDSIEIKNLFVHSNDKTRAQPYVGPEFKELDDELQDSLYEFLEARGIDDDLAIFLHEYMKNKDRTEYIGWMNSVKSYLEKN